MSEQAQLVYAGFWIRCVAMLIDGVLFGVLAFPLLISEYGFEYFDPDAPLFHGTFDLLVNFGLPIVYTLGFWHWRSATPGKLAFGISIVDADSGGNPTSRQFVTRYFAYVLSTVPCLLGFFWAGFDDRKQAWHDKVARTVLVRNKDHGQREVSFPDASRPGSQRVS